MTDRSRPRPGRPRGAERWIGVLAVVMTAVTGVSASAYWTATATGTSAAVTSSLAPPIDVVVPESSGAAVPVVWESGAGSPEAEGYYVTRTDGTITTAACASSPSALIETLDCTDEAVPDGSWMFLVTAVFRSWTATSAPSSSVSVLSAAALVFTIEPTDTSIGVPIAPPVTVALRTATGGPFRMAGVSVTLSIGTNPSGGDIVGGTSAVTDAEGSATFPDASITAAGVGYTLVAAGPGLPSVTSTPFAVRAQSQLGAAQPFSVLAASAVVCTGVSAVSGDLGVSPGTSISGFPPGTVGGEIHADDATAASAQDALAAAYANMAALPAEGEIVGNLGGRTITAGVYHSTAALALTGTLTLDAQGRPDAVFVFQSAAAFDTAAASEVILVNGALASNVYWVVAGASGTGANSSLSGNILSNGAITLGAGTLLIGRALSLDAVTLADATVRFTVALPPVVTIDGGATVITKDTTPTITGTSNAPSASPIVVTAAGQTLDTIVSGTGTWAVTLSPLSAGSYNVVVRVRDAAGNGSASSQTLLVEVNPAPVALGTAATYSVLAGTAVVSTGSTNLSGDLGVSPGTTVTGFPPGAFAGALHAGNAPAAAAQQDLLLALDEASARPPSTLVVGDLGGRTFRAGVHHSTAALALTGTLTLDAEGDPGAVFVFTTDAAFDTAAGAIVILANGAQAANVSWIVAGAAGTGANSVLSGSVLARGAITLGAGTALDGRALSRGTVTLAGATLTGVTPAPSGVTP